jgi:hypothetical protein
MDGTCWAAGSWATGAWATGSWVESGVPSGPPAGTRMLMGVGI